MSNEKMREEFEAAYVEGLIKRCGEGYLSTALYSLTERRSDGEYQNYPDFIAWWAWQASRAAIEVPAFRNYSPDGTNYYDAEAVDDAIESLGLKVKP